MSTKARGWAHFYKCHSTHHYQKLNAGGSSTNPREREKAFGQADSSAEVWKKIMPKRIEQKGDEGIEDRFSSTFSNEDRSKLDK